MSGRPDNLRQDPGYWLCMILVILCPPIWIIGGVIFLWNLPQYRREWKLERDCKERGHHLWGEYQDHRYWDIPHQFCAHCEAANPDSYAPLPLLGSEKP